MSLDTQNFIDQLEEKIEAALKEKQKRLKLLKDEIHKMNEFFWENYTEMDEYGYEDHDNQQQLFRTAETNRDTKEDIHRLIKLQDSPFFGGIEFVFDDEDEEDADVFYIGIANFSEKPGTKPLITDWRAPVASMFYDYDKGPASYEAPLGTMTGEILRKSQYKIRKGKLLYEFESDTKIDDEILMQELGKHGDVKMKNIIGTIQKEQNRIIRNHEDKIMIIQGAAGSGKTSIALHRIAYLLYHDRDRLKSSQVLILSPNGIFSDYISQILPELGEENIREMSFDVFAYHELKMYVDDTEDRSQQIERMMRQEQGEEGKQRIERYRWKQSGRCVEELEGFLLELEDSLLDLHDVTYTIQLGSKENPRIYSYTMEVSEIIDLLYNRLSDYPLLSRMQEVAERFSINYEDQFQNINRTGDMVLYDELEYYNLGNSEETMRAMKMDHDKEGQAIRVMNPGRRSTIRDEFLGMYRTRDLYDIYNMFLESRNLPKLPDVPKAERILPYEDVYPMLYLKHRLLRKEPHKAIRHLVVDEMQDYSYLQYSILNLMFNCSMTILGDRAQVLEKGQVDVLKFLPRMVGRKARVIELNRSYRNTLEIAQYAENIYRIEGIEYFERHGKPVEVVGLSDDQAICEDILRRIHESREGYETIAVLAVNEEEAAAMAARMKELQENVSYLDHKSYRFLKGITVTTWYLAKGLEFDSVYVLPADAQSEFHDPFLYISATRAMHELTVYERV